MRNELFQGISFSCVLILSLCCLICFLIVVNRRRNCLCLLVFGRNSLLGFCGTVAFAVPADSAGRRSGPSAAEQRARRKLQHGAIVLLCLLLEGVCVGCAWSLWSPAAAAHAVCSLGDAAAAACFFRSRCRTLAVRCPSAHPISGHRATRSTLRTALHQHTSSPAADRRTRHPPTPPPSQRIHSPFPPLSAAAAARRSVPRPAAPPLPSAAPHATTLLPT